MASAKITVTVPEEQLARMRELVAEGRVASVSGFVQHAVALALDDADGWLEELEAALQRTGGPMTEEERAWAAKILRGPKRGAA